MRGRIAGLSIVVLIVAIIGVALVVIGGQITGNVVEGVSQSIEASSEIIEGPSLESTLDDAVEDFGADAPVVGLLIRPQDMIYEVRSGSEVIERRIAVEEDTRFDSAQNREVTSGTIAVRDSRRPAEGAERRVEVPTLGQLDPAAQERMADAAGVPPSRLTAELDGELWRVQAGGGGTIVTTLDGTPLR